MAFVPLLLQCFWEKTLDMVFYTCIIVGGFFCPIYIRVVNSRTTSFAFINDVLISASSAYVMVFVTISHTFWMGLLSGGSSI